MAVFGGKNYANKTPANGGGGVSFNDVKLRDIVNVTTALAASDTIVFGAIPPGAVITAVGLKAASQLDSGGSPTLAFDVGLIAPFNAATGGTPAAIASGAKLKSAITTVGRLAGATLDTSSLVAANVPYAVPQAPAAPNVDQWVVAQVSAAAQTPAAGTLECWVTYHMEPTGGRPA